MRKGMTSGAARRRMILILVRVQNAVDAAHEASAEAAEMDAEFDGGEFSGPAHGQLLDAQCEKIARRFGFANLDLALEIAQQLGATVRMPAAFYGDAMPIPTGGAR